MADVISRTRKGLRTILEGIVATAAIAWQGRSFTPPTNGDLWYRETLLPGTSSVETLGPQGRIRHTGIYQIDVFAPILKQPGGDGTTRLDAAVAALSAAFTPNRVVVEDGQTITLRASFERRDLPPDGSWLRALVRVGWYADTVNSV